MRRIYFVTNGYPFTAEESPFIQPEIDYLVTKYEITLIACLTEGEYEDEGNDGEVKRLASKGVEIYRFVDKRKSRIQIICSIFRCITPSFFREIVRVLKGKEKVLQRLLLIYIHYTGALELYDYFLINGIIKDEQDCLYYSYWFHKAAHAGILLKKKKYDHLKIVSRIHGYDLYNEQGIAGYQPFKRQMDKGIDKLLFVSQQGRKYYLDHFADGSEGSKFVVNRLGVFDPGTVNKDAKQEKELHLVSCSSVYDVKRVHLIAEALSFVDDERVCWVHFGGGPDFDSLIQIAKELLDGKDNVHYELKGHVANQDVLKYYNENKPDCIINVSFSEGSSVSIQEAISYGMLVIATNVGGNSEMVDGNGVLLRSNPTPEEVAEAIGVIACKSGAEFAAMQMKSRNIWAEDFNREKNLIELGRILEELHDY